MIEEIKKNAPEGATHYTVNTGEVFLLQTETLGVLVYSWALLLRRVRCAIIRNQATLRNNHDQKENPTSA